MSIKDDNWTMFYVFGGLALVIAFSCWLWFRNFNECRDAGFSFIYCVTRK